MKRTLVALVAPLLLLAGCGDSGDSGPKEPVSFTVMGTLTLDASGSEALVDKYKGSPCSGKGGYGDIRKGAQVTVRDASGKTVALGSLSDGRMVTDLPDSYTQAPCAFQIFISEVPASDDSEFYSVEVASRGQIQFSRDKAKELSLTLG